MINQLRLRFERYESEIVEKNILLANRKKSDCRESVSSISTIAASEYEFDKLLTEKANIEDKLVKLKLKYAYSQSEVLEYEERNKELNVRISELETYVKNQQESLKLKEDIIKVFIEERKDLCITDPCSALETQPKTKLKKQSSLGNMFKGLFKK